MSARGLTLLGINFVLTARAFGPALPLLVYLALGYALVLHAATFRERIPGRLGGLVPLAPLGVWTLAWLLVKKGGSDGSLLDRLPSLGLAGIPQVVGSSYVFLKVYDLIRRVQNGARPPGAVQYLAQMTFYPSFVAGPIAGPDAFAHGFAPTRATVGEGANRILVGVLKLYVLVPLLGRAHLLGASNALDLAQRLSTVDAWIGVYASSLWIFFNFAGYSDIAIGTGLLMGVRLPENFDAPYLAASPSEFWQRWHVSFTTWLREHVFSPVSRALVAAGLGGTVVALVLGTTATMLACGVWHRFSLAFIAWGLYHALVVIVHQLYATRVKPTLAAGALGPWLKGRLYRALGTVATFHAMAIGWVLFMPIDGSLGSKLALLGRLFGL